MEYFITIPLLGLFDRVRGSGWFRYNHFIGMLLMGLLTAYMIGVCGWMMLFTVLAVLAGVSPGIGEPLGAAFDNRQMDPSRYEWWQVGFIKNTVFMSMVVRGIMWGMFLLPISIAAGIAYMVAFTSAPYIMRLVPLLPPNIDRWGIMEVLRGTVAGALIVVFTHCIGGF